jgi:hypothetical protein
MIVIASCCERVRKNGGCIGEVDAVFPEVSRGLRGVPFVLHDASICTRVHGAQELRLRGLTVASAASEAKSAASRVRRVLKLENYLE